MKKTILALGLLSLLSSQVMAAEVIKKCTSTLKGAEGVGNAKFKISIIQSDDQTSASVLINSAGKITHNKEDVTISTYKVRAGVTGGDSEETDDYNDGEALISHAMTLETDVIFEGQFSTGIKLLNKVRKVKVYQIGESTNMGLLALVETYDKNGKDMGTFMGGLLVGACK